MSFEHITESLTGEESRRERYSRLLEFFPAFFAPETDDLSSVCNVIALLHEVMGNLWTGVYFVRDVDQPERGLFLGFFQGSPACDTIAYGRGVCGTALASGETQMVEDVTRFPGHIACSSASRSEIVVPFRDERGRVLGVLDLDSSVPGAYVDEDRLLLETLLERLSPALWSIYRRYMGLGEG